MSCGNTISGADGISAELISAWWESNESFITQLFRECIRLCYNPSCFKLVEAVFLTKKKRNLSKAEWRSIPLLSYLRKGLERAIAKRMPYLAVISYILEQQQFEALLKRLTNDLFSYAVHDIREARCQGLNSCSSRCTGRFRCSTIQYAVIDDKRAKLD